MFVRTWRVKKLSLFTFSTTKLNENQRLLIERDPKRAQQYLERSLDIRVAKLGNEHHLVSRILHGLATVQDSFGNHEAAVNYHLRAIAIREKTLGKDHIQLSTSYLNLGTSYSLMEKYDQAISSKIGHKTKTQNKSFSSKLITNLIHLSCFMQRLGKFERFNQQFSHPHFLFQAF